MRLRIVDALFITFHDLFDFVGIRGGRDHVITARIIRQIFFQPPDDGIVLRCHNRLHQHHNDSWQLHSHSAQNRRHKTVQRTRAMKTFQLFSLATFLASFAQTNAFSMEMASENSRRAFVCKAAVTAGAFIAGSTLSSESVSAAPTVYNLNSGIKYAITKDSDKGYPLPGDIVAIDYTGYLTNGAIFDATHSDGKQNALLFKLGSTVVIPGINEMVAEMRVGQKVQAIFPPEMAFGDKGICLDDGECLVKPGSTLVYDIYLKKSSIPPP